MKDKIQSLTYQESIKTLTIKLPLTRISLNKKYALDMLQEALYHL